MSMQFDCYEWFFKSCQGLSAAVFQPPAVVTYSHEGNRSCWRTRAKNAEGDGPDSGMGEEDGDNSSSAYDPNDEFQLGPDGFHRLPPANMLADSQFVECCVSLYDVARTRSSFNATLFPMEDIKNAMQKVAKARNKTDELFSMLHDQLTMLASIEKCKEHSSSLNTPVMLCVGASTAAERMVNSRDCLMSNMELESLMKAKEGGTFKKERMLTIRDDQGEEYDEEHVWNMVACTATDLRKATRLTAEKINIQALLELSKVIWTRLHDYHRLVLMLNLTRTPDDKWPLTLRNFVPEEIICFFDTLARIAALIASLAGVQDKPDGLLKALSPKYGVANKAKDNILQSWPRVVSMHPPSDGIGPTSRKQMASGRYQPYEFPKVWQNSIKVNKSRV